MIKKLKNYRWVFYAVFCILTIIALMLYLFADGVIAKSTSKEYIFPGILCIFGGDGMVNFTIDGAHFIKSYHYFFQHDAVPTVINVIIFFCMLALIGTYAYELISELRNKTKITFPYIPLIVTLALPILFIFSPSSFSSSNCASITGCEYILGNGWIAALILSLTGTFLNTIFFLLIKFVKEDELEHEESVPSMDVAKDWQSRELNESEEIELLIDLRRQYKEGSITKKEFLKTIDKRIK